MIARETKVDISFFTAKDFLTERSARLRRAVIGGPLNATPRIQSFLGRAGQEWNDGVFWTHSGRRS